MPVSRGLVPPALITSTVVIALCSAAWGAFGVLSFVEPDALPTAAHRYLCILLATLTLGSGMVNLSARIVRVIRTDAQSVCGYVEGYTDGLEAAPISPAVSRLVPTRR